MTLPEALANLGRVRRAGWPDDWNLDEWEEHLWFYVGANRAAPWCPTPRDVRATDWVMW